MPTSNLSSLPVPELTGPLHTSVLCIFLYSQAYCQLLLSEWTCTHRPMAILAHFMHLHSQTHCPPPLCTYTCTHTLHNSAHCMDLHSQANCIFSSPHLNAQIFPLLSSAAVCTWTLTATAHFCCLNIPHAQRSWYICSLHIHALMAHPQFWSLHVPALKWSLLTSALRIQPY